MLVGLPGTKYFFGLALCDYSVLLTGDLWEALEEASGKPVGKVMHTWTAQMGFPVLKVTDKQVSKTDRQTDRQTDTDRHRQTQTDRSHSDLRTCLLNRRDHQEF